MIIHSFPVQTQSLANGQVWSQTCALEWYQTAKPKEIPCVVWIGFLLRDLCAALRHGKPPALEHTSKVMHWDCLRVMAPSHLDGQFLGWWSLAHVKHCRWYSSLGVLLPGRSNYQLYGLCSTWLEEILMCSTILTISEVWARQYNLRIFWEQCPKGEYILGMLFRFRHGMMHHRVSVWQRICIPERNMMGVGSGVRRQVAITKKVPFMVLVLTALSSVQYVNSCWSEHKNVSCADAQVRPASSLTCWRGPLMAHGIHNSHLVTISNCHCCTTLHMWTALAGHPNLSTDFTSL